MKKLVVLFSFFLIGSNLFAQMKSPVKWGLTAKKIKVNIYEVHITAEVEADWHIYSQFTPDGGPVATKFTFTKNPLLTLQGAVKEIGKLETHHEKLFGVDVKQFSKKVEFVQLVKVKAAVKTNLAGSIEFMVCNEKQCLPPTTKDFSISLK